MSKIVVEVLQADLVNAFRRTNLPTDKFGGFEDGFRLGVDHHARQRALEASGYAIAPSELDVEVRVVL